MDKKPFRKSVILGFGGISAVCALMMLSCSPKQPDRYNAQGVVISVEAADQGAKRVTILHEAITDFKDPSGKVVGMSPMPMTFMAAPGLSTSGINPQSKVRFTFEVHWDSHERLILKEIHSIDAATQLDLNGYSVEMV